MSDAARNVTELKIPEEKISGGHLVAKALKNEGVDVIFTLCGGHIIDIYDGCLDEGIKIVDVRHEQVAAHAADGYARQTGKPGCAVVTAGPGTTNAMTGIANAFRAERGTTWSRRPTARPRWRRRTSERPIWRSWTCACPGWTGWR